MVLGWVHAAQVNGAQLLHVSTQTRMVDWTMNLLLGIASKLALCNVALELELVGNVEDLLAHDGNCFGGEELERVRYGDRRHPDVLGEAKILHSSLLSGKLADKVSRRVELRNA